MNPLILWGILKPVLLKHGLSIVLVGLLVGQQISSGIQLRRLNAANNELKTQLSQALGTIAQLNDAVKTMRPGETRTITVDRPYPVTVTLPGQVITKEVPVVVTRTEKTIETKVETLTLPPQTIKEFIDKSPQTLVFEMTATRDIAKGERFRVIGSLIAPGVYQPILDIGAPITTTLTTTTPIEKIPQPIQIRRLTFSLRGGYSSYFAAPLAGVRADYKLTPHWSVETSFDHIFRNPSVQDIRVLAVLSF